MSVKTLPKETALCKRCDHQYRVHDVREDGYICRIIGCKCKRNYWG